MDDENFKLLLNELMKSDNGWTKKINEAPCVSLHFVKEYLLQSHQKKTTINLETFEDYTETNLMRYKTLRAYEHYASNHIHSMKYHHLTSNGSYCAVKCKCNPSWSTTVKAHDTIVVLEKDTGRPVGGLCACVAGLGEACTHVAALLFAMEDMTSMGMQDLPPDAASTEMLCKWTNPRSNKIQATPIRKVPITKRNPVKPAKRKFSNATCHNPVKAEKRGVVYEDVVKLQQKLNLIRPKLPWLTIAEPSRWLQETENHTFHTKSTATTALKDQYFGSNSIDISCLSEVSVEATKEPPKSLTELAQEFMERNQATMNESTVSQFIQQLRIDHETVNEISSLTIGQSENRKWFKYREGVITGSRIHDVHRKVLNIQNGKKTCPVANLVKEL